MLKAGEIEIWSLGNGLGEGYGVSREPIPPKAASGPLCDNPTISFSKIGKYWLRGQCNAPNALTLPFQLELVRHR